MREFQEECVGEEQKLKEQRTPVMGHVVVNMSSMKLSLLMVKLKRVHPQK